MMRVKLFIYINSGKLLIIWTIIMLTLTSIPGKHLSKAPFLSFDKLIHGFEFFVWGTLFTAWIRKHTIFKKWHILLRLGLAFLACLLLAGLDELHQLIIPARTASMADFFADIIGATLGIGLAALLFND